MKKQLFFIAIVILPLFAIAQIYVPDDNFEQALIDLGYDSGSLDDYVPFSNISGVTSLDISSKGISDLTGINGFPSLQTLYCNDNQLSTISLSNNSQLRDLRLNDNNLVFITLSNLTQLEIFSANNNQLSSLNVASNPALRALSVSQNNLTTLDTSSNPFLVQILCDRNQLTSLTIDTFSDLTDLYCYDNQLTSLDLTTNFNLEILWCRTNKLTSINTTGITSLKTYVAYDNELASIDVSTNTALDVLSLGDNNMSTINISNNTLLTELYLSSNQFTTLDVTSNPLLEEFWCQRNQINTLNTSGLSALKTYVAYDNQLATIDVSTNTGLDLLSLGTNNLSAIDVSNNTLLTELYLSRNQLSTIDLQLHTALEKFGIFDNQLSTIDLTNNSNLQLADIGTNDYTSIDLTANTQLTEIYIQNCPNLEEVNVKNGANQNLTNFLATDNPNLSCIEVDDPATSTANWSGIDPGTIFNIDCNYGNVYVPDDAFEQALIDLGYDTAPLDDYVITENINTVTNLDISNLGIVDMTGIEAFVALEDLNCSGNSIANLTISANTLLTDLNVSNNMITELDLTTNLVLVNLNVNTNRLNLLDLNNQAQLVDFEGINNDLILLFIKNGNNTNVTNFAATNNPNLTCIEVDDVAYSTANWTNIDTQTSFNTDCNQFYTYVPDDIFEQTLIDLGYDSGALNNYVLTTNINTITTLDVSNKGIADLTGIHDFTAIEQLNCSYNALNSLDIRPNANLEVLNCSFNVISSIDVSNNYALRSLTLWNNVLTELNVNNNSALEYLDVDRNTITTLDLSYNTQLTTLYANANELERLNVKNGNNTNVNVLNTYGNTNLACIQVDDTAYSTANWLAVDPHSSFSDSCNYDFTYVPDDAFEQALVDLGYDTAPLDDYVPKATVAVITTLDISNIGINDLTGIEDFTALQELNCSSNTLGTLDVRNNLNLTNLNCASNALTELNILTNIQLTTLNASGNMLSILNVLNNTLLESVNINNNNIKVFKVNFHPVLNELYANNNTALEVLNVKNGNNTNFISFSATGNPSLTCIQVDDATWSTTNWTNIDNQASFNQDCGYGTYVPDDNFEQALIDLGFDSGPLDDYVPTANFNAVTFLSLDIRNKGITDLTGIEDFSTLYFLRCSNNSITHMNMSNNTILSSLYCNDNDLTYLNVSIPNLSRLECHYNDLTTLDLSNTPELKNLNAEVNDFTTIDFSANIKLEELNIRQNDLKTLELPTNTLLKVLDCEFNRLTNINVSNTPLLETILFGGNKIKTIDFSNNINLTEIDGDDNFLAELDLSANVNLLSLNLARNDFTTIDVSANVLLKDITMSNGFLSEISLATNVDLEEVYFSSNRLKMLDLSNNINITYMALSSNELTALNVQNGNNTNVTSFNTVSNPNLYCVVVDDTAYSTANWSSVPSQVIFNETSCDYIELGAKVLLQGASLNPNTGEESLMRDDLRVNGLINETSPYADGATAAVIVRSDDNAANSMVDWVWVELRAFNDPRHVVAGQSGILQRDGDIVATDDDLTTPLIFDGLPVAKYHVVVKHRNHLGVMTASSVTLKQTMTTVDFTNATNQIAYGNNAQTTFGMQTNKAAMWAGNVNGDTIVQYSGTNPDTPAILSTVLNAPGNFLNFPTFSVSGYTTDDLNMDGSTQYSGTNPDTPVILQNVLAHPGNFLNFSTYQIIEQLPGN